MKYLYEKGDIVARHLYINRPKDGKIGHLITFVGVCAEEESKNPDILNDVIVFAKESTPKYVGTIDFSGGWEDKIPQTEKHSEYNLFVGHTVVPEKDIRQDYVELRTKEIENEH